MSNTNSNELVYEAHIARGMVTVRPNCENLVDGLFDHDGLSFHTDQGRLRINRGGPLFELSPDTPVSVFPIGFLTRVLARIESHGHAVRVTDHRRLAPLAFDRAHGPGAQFETRYPGLLQAIVSSPNGIVDFARGRGRNKLIGNLCHVLSQLRILVIGTTLDTVRDVYEAIHERIGSSVIAVHGETPAPDVRVVVGTQAVLRQSDSLDRQLLLFEDVDEAQSIENVEILWCEWQNHRYYAFRDSPPTSLRTRLYHEGMFGLSIFPVAGSGTSINPIVSFASYSAQTQRIPDDAHAIANAVHCCQPRLHAIARIAAAWARGDLSTIGPESIQVHLPDQFSCGGSLRRVLVLAASVQQAEGLARHIAMLIGATRSLSNSVHRIQLPWLGFVEVCPPVAASKLNRIDADLIIVAGGGRNPALPTAIQRLSHRALIIDFVDEWHTELLKQTDMRHGCYRVLGFEIIGHTPATNNTSRSQSGRRRGRRSDRRARQRPTE